MVYDFHTHTSLSDGRLAPAELVRRAAAIGYQAIGVTDHISVTSLERIIQEISGVCTRARSSGDILAIPGVELTQVPAELIAETAKRAKALGAWIVVVHGETIVEPVPDGTNRAAILCPDVDILAHPGLITPDLVQLAAERDIYLEISARRGHCLTNGHVAALAKQYGAKLLVDTDAHAAEDLLTTRMADGIIRGTGLDEASCLRVLQDNPLELLNKLKRYQS